MAVRLTTGPVLEPNGSDLEVSSLLRVFHIKLGMLTIYAGRAIVEHVFDAQNCIYHGAGIPSVKMLRINHLAQSAYIEP